MPKHPQLLCSTGPFYMMPIGQVFESFSRSGFNGAEVMVTSEKATQDPKVADALESRGATVFRGTPEDFYKFVADEIEKWAPVVKRSGVRPD